MTNKIVNCIQTTKLPIPIIALSSRIIIILIQFVSNHLIPDHDAHVFVSPKTTSGINADAPIKYFDRAIESVLGGFNRWDGQYFLHIAEYGYTYENTLAFYPLYPYCVRIVANCFYWLVSGFVSYHNLLLLAAILINMIVFIESAKTLYQLSALMYKNDVKRCRFITILYCFNPASIFFTAPYTECFFACLSFKVMLKLHGLHKEKSSYSFQSILPLVLSVLCRSNGLINFGFLLYFTLKIFAQNYSIRLLLKFKIIAVLVLLAYASLQYYYYNLFCEANQIVIPEHVRSYGIAHDYVLAGGYSSKSTASPWCNNTIPLSYSYIQNHYWSVGLFQYYELKQLPNFLLAAPIIVIFVWYHIQYVRNNLKLVFNLKRVIRATNNLNVNLIPYVLHSVFLLVFGVLFVHIQVVTRLLCSSSPMLYWIGTEILYDKKLSIKYRDLFVTWFKTYYFVGTVMFCNFLPWT